jgi:hypothetical protein
MVCGELGNVCSVFHLQKVYDVAIFKAGGFVISLELRSVLIVEPIQQGQGQGQGRAGKIVNKGVAHS